VTLGLLISAAARALGVPTESLVPEAIAVDVPLEVPCPVDWASIDPHALGRTYEASARALVGGGRKATGAFYTPLQIARFLAREALSLAEGAGGRPPTVTDPACGCGSLLIEALRHLCEERGTPPVEAAAGLRGYDRDAAAVSLARLALTVTARHLGARGSELRRVADLLGANLIAGDALMGEALVRTDCVLMNPPYIRAARAGGNRVSIRRRFPTAVGAFDLQVPFVELALGCVREGGALGLLTSNKLLVADYGRALRRRLAEEVTVVWLVDLADCRGAQPSALVSQAILIAVKREAADGHEVMVMHPRGVGDLGARQTPVVRRGQAVLLGGRWPALRGGAEEEETARRMTEGDVVRLDSLALVRGGVRGFDYRACGEELSERTGAVVEMPVLCPGNIRAYDAPSGGRVRLLGRAWEAPCLRARPKAIPERLWELFAEPKVVVKGVGARPTAAWVPGRAALLVAVWGIWGEEARLWEVLALLNSLPAAWLHYYQLHAARIPQGSLRIPLSWVASFPVPRHGAAPAGELARELWATADRGRRAELQRQIDRVVAEAYGLDETQQDVMARAPAPATQV